MSAPDDRLDAAAAARALCAAMVDDPLPMVVSRWLTAADRASVEDARLARLIAIGEAVEAAPELNADHPGGIADFALGWNALLRKLRAS